MWKKKKESNVTSPKETYTFEVQKSQQSVWPPVAVAPSASWESLCPGSRRLPLSSPDGFSDRSAHFCSVLHPRQQWGTDKLPLPLCWPENNYLPKLDYPKKNMWIPPCCESSPPRKPGSTPPTGLNECFFFNSLVVGLPYSLIFWQFWLFLVLNLVLSFF